MNRRLTATLTSAAVVLVGLAAAGTAATATAGVQRPAAAPLGPGGTWGAAKPLSGVPGKGVSATGVPAMSCASAGNCSLIGYYSLDGSVVGQGAFVASETAGVWGHPQAIPGLGTLNVDREVGDLSISCATPGNCAAAGFYTRTTVGPPEHDAFVANQVHGVWGKAQPVSAASLGAKAGSWLGSVSCGSPGNCSAVGGYFITANVQGEAFAITETNGSWGAPQAVPGLTAILPVSQFSSDLFSVSCAAQGDCAAIGLYQVDTRGGQLEFVVEEKNGTWGDAQLIPGLAALATNNFASLPAVSCSAAGECTVAGSFSTGAAFLPFTATESGGTWGNATELPGVPALDTGGIRAILLSCPAAGSCALADDYYQNTPFVSPIGAFTATEHNGTWGNPQAITGLPNSGSNVAVNIDALSCPSAGNCSLGGYYVNEAKHPAGPTAFVDSESIGTWHGAHRVVVPSIGVNAGQVTAVSCGSTGYCSAAIFNSGQVGLTDVRAGFVVNEATASATRLTLSTAKLTYGHENAEHLAITVTGWRGLTPSGRVTIKAGKATVCTVTLKSGKGGCTLTLFQLKPGTYHLTASYAGSAGYLSSTSPAKTLTIVK